MLSSARGKRLLHAIGLLGPIKAASDRHKKSAWLGGDQSGPPPQIIKEEILRDLGKRHKVRSLIETGTFKGDMLYALRNDFEDIHSIEIGDFNHRESSRRLQRFGHVHIHHGSSAETIGQVVDALTGPALFWLDGHYHETTPIMAEVAAVFGDDRFQHVVAIDDAHSFVGQGEYPALDEFQRHLSEIAPDHSYRLESNVIQLEPRS